MDAKEAGQAVAERAKLMVDGSNITGYAVAMQWDELGETLAVCLQRGLYRVWHDCLDLRHF